MLGKYAIVIMLLRWMEMELMEIALMVEMSILHIILGR